MNLKPTMALILPIAIGLSCVRPASTSGGQDEIRKALQSPESMPTEWLVKLVGFEEVREFCLNSDLTQLLPKSAPALKDHWAQVNQRFQSGDELWMWNSCIQKPPFPDGYTSATGYCIKRGQKIVYAFQVAMSKVRSNQKVSPGLIEEPPSS